MEVMRFKEIVSVLMESTFYFDLPLPERLGLVRYLLDADEPLEIVGN